MTNSRVDVLIVTPPDGHEKVSILNARGENAKVAVQSTDDGFGWTLENLPEMDYLMVYGTTSSSAVRVDGNVLPNVTTANSDSMPIGWTTDLVGNRLLIRLPSRQVEDSELTMKIEVDVNPSKK
jgi:hypothetical protein